MDSSGTLSATGIGTANLIGVYNYVSGSTSNPLYQFGGGHRGLQPAASAGTSLYSFTSDASDSVGGSAWNGTLPNGGTFAGGQLALASSSSQYVQLPAGILSNYTWPSPIETLVAFPEQLPANCFFYCLGNTDSAGSGENYIFLQRAPRRTHRHYGGRPRLYRRAECHRRRRPELSHQSSLRRGLRSPRRLSGPLYEWHSGRDQ